MRTLKPEDRAEGENLAAEFLAMDRKARAQGHSLLAVLNHAARSGMGIDLTPDPEPAGVPGEGEV